MDQNPSLMGSHLWLGNPGSNITKEYERCFSEAEGSGVALRQGKGTTLGERRSKADAALPVEPKTTHWQVEGAPRAWSVEKFAIFWQNKSGKMSLHSQMPEDGRSVPQLPTTMFVMFMKPVNIQSLSTMLAGDLSRGSKKIQSQGRHRPSSQTYLFLEQNQ